MGTFTVSFFGHAEICPDMGKILEHKVFLLLKDMVNRNENVIFLAGRNKGFDRIAATAIHNVKRWVRSDNSVFYLVLHGMEEYYRKFIDMQDDHYDEIEICEESLRSYKEISFYVRDQAMIDRSDMVVVYISSHDGSGHEYDAYRYAVKAGKNILNLAEDE